MRGTFEGKDQEKKGFPEKTWEKPVTLRKEFLKLWRDDRRS